MARKFILFVFWLCALTDLYAIASGNEKLHMVFKPTLMICLLITLFLCRPSFQGKGFIITAILFSWMGDIYLMFENRDPLFFILGLVSFLIAHLFYIIFFVRPKGKLTWLLFQKPWMAGIILIYVTCLLALILPNAGKLSLPVTVYALVLSAMLLSSLHAYYRFEKKTGLMFVSGAVFFVISDSLLAINKFYVPLGAASILIMLTYCIAQFLIITACINLSPTTIPEKATHGVY